MNIVPNLPYSDERNSNCRCIVLYRRNPQITPALCSKCSSTLKYFGLTESIKDVFKSNKFGCKDTSSLAVTSDFKIWNLHQKNFVGETYNSHLEDKEQLKEILKKAVVDDILIPSSLNN